MDHLSLQSEDDDFDLEHFVAKTTNLSISLSLVPLVEKKTTALAAPAVSQHSTSPSTKGHALMFNVTTSKVMHSGDLCTSSLSETDALFPVTCVRTFTQIEILRRLLVENHAEIIVPSMPDAPFFGLLTDHDHREKKRRRCQRFLQRCADNRELSMSECYLEFLTQDDFFIEESNDDDHGINRKDINEDMESTNEPPFSSPVSRVGSWFRKVAASASSVVSTTTLDHGFLPNIPTPIMNFGDNKSTKPGAIYETASSVSAVRKNEDDGFFVEMTEKLIQIEKSSQSMIDAISAKEIAHKGLNKPIVELGIALNKLGESKHNTKLERVCNAVCGGFEMWGNALNEQAKTVVRTLGDCFVEWVRNVDAARFTVNSRTKALQHWSEASKAVIRKDEEYYKFNRALDFDPTKTKKAGLLLEKCKQTEVTAKERFYTLNDTLHIEVTALETERSSHWALVLCEHARDTLTHERELLDTLRNVLRQCTHEATPNRK